jgi:hypothetical protein
MDNNQPCNVLLKPSIEPLIRLQRPRQRRLVRALSGEKEQRVPPRNNSRNGRQETRQEGIVRDESRGREVTCTNTDDLLAFKVDAYCQTRPFFWGGGPAGKIILRMSLSRSGGRRGRGGDGDCDDERGRRWSGFFIVGLVFVVVEGLEHCVR